MLHRSKPGTSFTWLLLPCLLIVGCSEPAGEFDEYIEHWKVTETYMTFQEAKLELDTVGRSYRVVNGSNHVLTVNVVNEPVFKPGQELTDLYSSTTLLIELDTSDRVVTNTAPSKSTLRKLTVAFTPEFGIKPLWSGEKLEIRRVSDAKWHLSSEVRNFQMDTTFDFSKNDTLVIQTVEE